MRGAFRIQRNPEESVCSERGPVQVVEKAWDSDTAGGRGKRYIRALCQAFLSSEFQVRAMLQDSFQKSKQQQQHKIKIKQTKPKPQRKDWFWLLLGSLL